MNYISSIGFKAVSENKYVLSEHNNIKKLFITPSHGGDVFLPGNTESPFKDIVLEETTNKGIYDISFIDGNDKIKLKSADIKDLNILMQSLINRCYQEKGYDFPYSFNLNEFGNTCSHINIYSPFHSLDINNDGFIISHIEDDVKILQNPEITYSNYELVKNDFDYTLEAFYDKFVTEYSSKKINVHKNSF